MRKTGILTIVFVMLSTSFGCGASTGDPGRIPSQTAQTQTANDMPASNSSARTAPVGDEQSTGPRREEKMSLVQARMAQIDTAPTDRKIIRNAELSLESGTPEEAQQRIVAIAERHGGFVVESQQTSSDLRATRRDTVTMSVRVPAAQFAATIDEIRQASDRVIFETLKGDDVTEEFIDVEARVRAKKALEQQFMEIMKRAGNVEDALNVQSELAAVRGEIERIEGRRRFLENQSSLSTIKIKLQTPAAFSASSSGFSHRLGESFGTGLDFALNFVLGLVTFVIAVLPFALLVGLPTLLIIRYLWKRQIRPRSVGEIAKEELRAT